MLPAGEMTLPGQARALARATVAKMDEDGFLNGEGGKCYDRKMGVDLGYTDLWSAESGGYDAFTPLVAAAQWAPELRFGTAIVPVYTRGAMTLEVLRERLGCA